jgi:hypothetical protein
LSQPALLEVTIFLSRPRTLELVAVKDDEKVNSWERRLLPKAVEKLLGAEDKEIPVRRFSRSLIGSRTEEPDFYAASEQPSDKR